MKLILISPSSKLDMEIPFIIKMFEAGLPTYHLRKVKYSTLQLNEFISNIPPKFHNRIVIHSHHKLALKYKLKGIYVSRSHKKNQLRLWLRLNWIKLRKKSLEVSSSYRSIEAIYHINHKYNYIFLSPAFDSNSGNVQASFSHSNLKNSLKGIENPIIARGGVSADNLDKANELGFAGVALYSAIWKSEEPVREFIKVIEKFKVLGLPVE